VRGRLLFSCLILICFLIVWLQVRLWNKFRGHGNALPQLTMEPRAVAAAARSTTPEAVSSATAAVAPLGAQGGAPPVLVPLSLSGSSAPLLAPSPSAALGDGSCEWHYFEWSVGPGNIDVKLDDVSRGWEAFFRRHAAK
jgi:hypothetical protein